MQAKVEEMFLRRTAQNNLRPLKRYDDLVRCIMSQAFWGHPDTPPLCEAR